MTIPTTVSVAPADEYPADGHTMTDKLTATLDKAGVRAISTDLWGIFFEDISYSGDGGLNADLVQNGAFEYNRADSIDWSNYSFWRKIVPEGSFAAFGIHDNDPVATENPHYATVEVEHAPAALDNTGWDGMVFRAGETYDFTAWMRVRSESAMPVTVSLRGDDGSIIAENTITVSASAWTTYQASLTVPEHGDAGSSVATQGTLRLAFAGEGVIDLDFVTLEPRTTYHGLKHFRPDLVEALADLKPRFMRFPGGCIVEGVTPGNEYRWKDTVGSLAARRQQYSMWSFKMPDGSSYSQSHQIGFYEYFCLCEDLKAKPLPTLFAGIACQSPGRDPRHMDINSATFRNNVIQDYLDLIEFANGDPESSSWAAVRRDMGHPEPFGLDMIGVGNENFGADYVAKFDMISEAIHERYPDMLCVMSAGLFPFQPAMKRSWDHARALAATDSGAHDSATGDAIIVDEHSYHSPEWFASQASRFDAYPRCGAGVYFGEYSANGYFAGQPQTEQGANTWKSALGEAAFLTGCERNSDVVRMTSYAPLLAHIPAKGWAQNLIEFNPAHVNPTVNYEVERLFSTHLGDTTYAVSIEQTASRPAKHLYVSATGHDRDDACRYIKIVNISDSPVDVTLEIARGLAGLGASPSRPVRLEVTTLSPNPTAKTTIGYRGEASGAIVPERRAYTLPSPSSLLAMKIKPYSVTLVVSR